MTPMTDDAMTPMVTLHTATSDALSFSLVKDIRALLDAAFEGDFSDHDWDHALGGVHVWLTEATGVVGHGSLVARTLVCSGKALQVGYLEAVAIKESYRRSGLGTTLMRRLDALICEGYPLGALSTGAYGFYATLGWERWRGPTFVDAPDGRVRTPDDDDDIMILRTPRSPRLDLEGEIVCDWRQGDVW